MSALRLSISENTARNFDADQTLAMIKPIPNPEVGPFADGPMGTHRMVVANVAAEINEPAGDIPMAGRPRHRASGEPRDRTEEIL